MKRAKKRKLAAVGWKETSVKKVFDLSDADMKHVDLRRRKAAAKLIKVLDGIRAQPGEPMTLDEIQAEVIAVRAERRARQSGQ